MWGYRNERYREFGWAAARLDDLLNWIPARLVALSYAGMGNFESAWRCWREQAHLLDSPNAGPVMTAGAGALQLHLGGDASYGGRRKLRPQIGCGSSATAEDIPRTLSLLRRAVVLWILVMIVVEFLL